jgi:hypothetical protein
VGSVSCCSVAFFDLVSPSPRLSPETRSEGDKARRYGLSHAIAPLRVSGLARSLLENKDNPAEIERIANELLALEPHLIELLIAEGEKAPALT